MNSSFRAHEQAHFVGDNATHPIEPRWRTLVALLLLAGRSPQRRRALPAHPITAHSGASNCGFKDYSPR